MSTGTDTYLGLTLGGQGLMSDRQTSPVRAAVEALQLKRVILVDDEVGVQGPHVDTLVTALRALIEAGGKEAAQALLPASSKIQLDEESDSPVWPRLVIEWWNDASKE